MKKTSKIIIAVMVILSLTFAVGCSGNKSAVENTDNKTTGTQHISLGTAGTGGAYYPLGGAIANIINRFVPGVEATAEVTGGSAENVLLVGTNELQMGMANSNLIYAGYQGKEPYKEKYDQLRGLFTIMPSVIQIVTLDNSGINSVGDLKGKRVVLGPAGGGQIVMFAEYIKYFGMDMDDINAVYISFSEGINNLLDGNADAVLVMAAIPTSAVMELDARSNKYKILEFEEDVIQKLVADSPYFTKFVLPANTYTHQTKEVVTIAATSGVFVRAEMDEETAYNICKQVYEHLDILVSTVASTKVMNIENGKDLPIPLHPGAEKFFKEKGVLPK